MCPKCGASISYPTLYRISVVEVRAHKKFFNEAPVQRYQVLPVVLSVVPGSVEYLRDRHKEFVLGPLE
jgi:hypothetical protein